MDSISAISKCLKDAENRHAREATEKENKRRRDRDGGIRFPAFPRGLVCMRRLGGTRRVATVGTAAGCILPIPEM
jgi:hypothetical protein